MSRIGRNAMMVFAVCLMAFMCIGAEGGCDEQPKPQQAPPPPPPIAEVWEPVLVVNNVLKFPGLHKTNKNVFEKSLVEWNKKHPDYMVVGMSGQPGNEEWMTYVYVVVAPMPRQGQVEQR